MARLLTSEKIYLSDSKIANAERGVFAKLDIVKSETIEICPLIEVSKNDTANLTESILNSYFFYFGKKKDRLAVALGFGSIYNHSNSPNAKFNINLKEKTIDFIALSDIKKDTEITFNYYGSEDLIGKKSPLWFEV